jgi:folate-binding protein YgfZ
MTSASAIVASREGALLIPRPDLGTLHASGPDAQAWLNGLLTCDVKALANGQGAWGLALTKQGKIQSDTNVLVTNGGVYLSTAPGVTRGLLAVFQEFLIMEDAEISDVSAEYAWLTLHGPLSVASAQAVAGAHGASLAAIDWTGLGGAALLARRAVISELEAELERRPGVVLGSREVWERLRIERLVPEYGIDFGTGDNPHEASLDRRAVSWTKGCYLGQEVVCMQDMRGRVKRRIVSVAAAGPAVLEPGLAVLANGEPVGEITSSWAAPASGPAVALARVAAKALDEGMTLTAGGQALSIAKAPGG